MFKKINTSFLIPLIGIIGIFLLTGGDIAHANVVVQGTDAKAQDMLNGIVAGLNIILDILTIVVTPAIMFASWLMSPDWTSGDIFNLRPKMHELWITVSNITYFIYAILLIFIALATIFNNEHYGYKALLPKLALGIILVPMTWWFVQFIISLSTIVTASVINIPAEVVAKYEGPQSDTFWNKPSIPKNMAYRNNTTNTGGSMVATDKDGKELGKNESGEIDCSSGGNNCLSPKEIVQGAGGLYGNLLVYSFGVFKFQNNKKIALSGTDVVVNIGKIINQGIIGAMMFFIYGILVIALIFMLITRAIKLWFYAIFSPLFTLRFVLKDDFKKAGDDDDMFSISEFIGLAFVPAVVGLTLSFGLMIVASMMSPSEANKNQCTGTSATCKMPILGSGDNFIESKIDEAKKVSSTVIKFGGVSYTFEGNVSGDNNTTGIISSALSTSGGILGTIIIDIMALMFIWVAFMAGMKISKVASKAVDPFKKMGAKIGEFGAKLPTYAPIPGTGTSMAGLSKISDKLEQKFESAQQNKIANSKLGQFVGLDSAIADALQTKLSNVASSATENITLKKEVVTGLQSESKNNQIKGVAALGNDSRTRYMEADGTSGKFKFKANADSALFKTNLRALGLDDTQIQNIENAMIAGKFDENYLRNDGKGIAIFKRIMENKGSTTGAGATSAGTGSINTVNNFTISRVTAADISSITASNTDSIGKIADDIKRHLGDTNASNATKNNVTEKLRELLPNTITDKDAIIAAIISKLPTNYLK